MLRKLTNIFNQNQSSKTLDFAEVNSSKKDIDFRYFQQLKQLTQATTLNQLLTELQRGWTSTNAIEKLKFYIATHYLIAETANEQICQRCASHRQTETTTVKDEGPEAWIRRNIVDYYCEYVQRVCQHIELYGECLKRQRVTVEQLQRVETTANCFKVVNLLNFILKSQISLNKIGRYYPKLTVMCQLFMMYIKDVEAFYTHLQRTIDGIFACYRSLTNEMLRHSFVFIVEVQKTLDQLQEFLNNRYFYKHVGAQLPHIQQIDRAKYKELVRYIRSVDRTIDIPRVVPMSGRMSKLDELNRTMMAESKNRRNASLMGGLTHHTSFSSSTEMGFEEKFSTLGSIAHL